MNSVDLSQLCEVDSEYQKIVSSLFEAYEGDWDDAVHESFFRYVKSIRETSDKLHDIRKKVESVCREVEAFRVTDVLARAENLCREADSI